MRRVLLGFLLLALSAAPISAQPFETTSARALGMGGAFVAVADDVSAVWWNPAGLASGALFSVVVERSQFDRERTGLFGAPSPADRSAFFLAAGSLPLGLSYVSARETYAAQGPADEAIVRDLITRQAGATVVQSLSDFVVVAATLKYVRGSAATGLLNGTDLGEAADGLEREGSNAFDADIGVMVNAGALKAGLTFRNVTSPAFEATDGTELELPWLARVGVSYLVTPSMTVAADVDLRTVERGLEQSRSLAIGSEYRLTRFAFRAGARIDTIGDTRPLGTVGGSYAVRNGIWVDMWAAGGSKQAERGWGLAGRVVF
ncbi:MAG: conjugal transfer protein TraF [Acidobacteriota bacterium]|nr:conjugal transfer protein TraF [Acidobacteriota bacterium]